MSLEILSILNAKTIKFDVGTGGGTPIVTQMDVAGALSRLGNFRSDLLRFKLSGQTELAHKIVMRVVEEAFEMSKHENWDIRIEGKKISPIVSMCMSVVDEFYSCRCKACKGVGETKNKDGRVIQCQKCDGSGLINKTGRERARASGISKSIYFDVWQTRYESLLSFLRSEESIASSEFTRAMK